MSLFKKQYAEVGPLFKNVTLIFRQPLEICMKLTFGVVIVTKRLMSFPYKAFRQATPITHYFTLWTLAHFEAMTNSFPYINYIIAFVIFLVCFVML